MAFEVDAGMDCINLKDGDIADVIDESIKEPVEVIPTCRASVIVMIGGHTKEVVHIRTHSLKNLEGFLPSYLRQRFS